MPHTDPTENTDESPDPRLIAAAEQASPLKDGCPNTPNCGHVGYLHDIEDFDDPLPMCGVAGCRCGRPPAGWARVPGQVVIAPGGTVPSGMDVFDPQGAVYEAADRQGAAWVNATDSPLIEIERIARNGGA